MYYDDDYDYRAEWEEQTRIAEEEEARRREEERRAEEERRYQEEQERWEEERRAEEERRYQEEQQRQLEEMSRAEHERHRHEMEDIYGIYTTGLPAPEKDPNEPKDPIYEAYKFESAIESWKAFRETASEEMKNLGEPNHWRYPIEVYSDLPYPITKDSFKAIVYNGWQAEINNDYRFVQVEPTNPFLYKPRTVPNGMSGMEHLNGAASLFSHKKIARLIVMGGDKRGKIGRYKEIADQLGCRFLVVEYQKNNDGSFGGYIAVEFDKEKHTNITFDRLGRITSGQHVSGFVLSWAWDDKEYQETIERQRQQIKEASK